MEEKIHLSLSYTKDLDQKKLTSTNVDILHMGIGSKETLHGYPDSKVRGKQSNIHIIFPYSEDAYSSSPSSMGDSIIIERTDMLL